MSFRRIAVYCGANPGRDPRYRPGARAFGSWLAGRGIGVVYGGGNVGLMGALADGAIEGGGEVIGVIPEKLMGLELAHTGITRLEVVEGMHPRKLRMAELADGFVAMPGGYGTLEELFEVVTWAQLEYHHKPVGLLNIGGFWDPLVKLLDHLVEQGVSLGRRLQQRRDDREALLARALAQPLADVEGHGAVEARGDLVERERARVRQQALADRDALLLAAAHAAHEVVADDGLRGDKGGSWDWGRAVGMGERGGRGRVRGARPHAHTGMLRAGGRAFSQFLRLSSCRMSSTASACAPARCGKPCSAGSTAALLRMNSKVSRTVSCGRCSSTWFTYWQSAPR